MPRARSLGFIVVAVLAVTGICAAVITMKSNAELVSQPLGVEPLGRATTSGWSIEPRGVLVTAGDRTRIVVRLTRRSEADRTPALTGNFDGSGGGEARLITCTARSRKWGVPIHQNQTIPLNCDTRVDPSVVKQMHFVYAGQR